MASSFPSQKQETQQGKERVLDPTPQFATPNYEPSNKLHGKVALVTGGDSGIGQGREDKDAEDMLHILREAKLERVFRTNIFSQFFMAKYAKKHMKEGSSIINTMSVVAYTGNHSLLEYTATKGATVAFTQGLVLQLVKKGIRVNGVAPGPIWTPLVTSSFRQEEVSKFGSEVPMQRAGQPIKIAPSYVFLACNHCSSYFSGQILHPNGGVIVNA